VKFNIFACNRKLRKHVKDGQLQKVIQLFQEMQQQGGSPNNSHLFKGLKACTALQTLEEGRLVHKQVIQTGCESDVLLRSSLVDMYAKCGSIEDAWRVFNKCQLKMWSLGAPQYWDM
jgi:pentatricopeptide repeat protein